MNSILKKLFNLLFISSGLLYGAYVNAIEESTNWAFSRIHTNALPSSLNIDYDSLSLYFKQRPIQISQKNLVIGNICTIKLSKEDIIPLDLQKMLTVDVNQYFIDKATDYPFIQLFTNLEIKAPYDFYQFNLPGMQIAFPDWMKKNTIKGYETQAFGNPFELSQSDCSMNLISNHFRKAVFNEKYLIIFFSVYSVLV
ncbi:hypothetical protein [Thorsellia anophelis]|uniref:Uncharacterized protein n=1 Tax=Thorsellia anophelis DSM 18579 TaxID=1123402 RepID=A0A1I0E853_9GAMM|nr:hypothetical protein [Thorsellia anophelis]SET41365.1 hypothetical protein SAMN02583745_02284 [Thorsellia anophelis DSM 18579]